MPQPPYVLLFEEVVPGARPLTILVDDRSAMPLFDSEEKAFSFVASTDFGAGLEPVEVSGAGLIRALESVGDEAMKVRMGGVQELVEALQQGQEDDLFGLGGISG